MSNQKRSLGITLMASLIILFASFLLLTCMNSRYFILVFKTGSGMLFYLFSISIYMFSIVFAINILKLQDKFRVFLIYLSFFNIMLLFISPLFMKGVESLGESLKQEVLNLPLEKKEQIDRMVASMEQEIDQKYPLQQREALKDYVHQWLPLSIKAITNIYAFFSFLWSLWVIFFFTRPKVKAQFIGDDLEAADGTVDI